MNMSKLSGPIVSIILPVFNAEAYLPLAIKSIQHQTFKHYECIAIDDGSRDGSGVLLDEVARCDSRWHVIHQANAGLITTLNTGLGLAQGKYIARMDADDVSLPKRLEVQVAFLDSRLDVGLLGTTYGIIDPQGKLEGIQSVFTDDRDLRLALLHTHAFAHGSVMFRRSVLDQLQPPAYRTEAGRVEDVELWMRFSHRTRLANTSEVLFLWRRVPTSISHSSYAQQRMDANRVYRAYARSFDWRSQIRSLPWSELRRMSDSTVVIQGQPTKIKRREMISYHLVQLAKLTMRFDRLLTVQLLWNAIVICPRFFIHGLWFRMTRRSTTSFPTT